MYYYAGVRSTFGVLSLDFALAYVDYPGGSLFTGLGVPSTCTNRAFFLGSCNTSKADLSYWEPFIKGSLAVNDSLSLTGAVYYSPSWVNSGAPGTFASFGTKIALPSDFLPKKIGASLSVEVGHYWLGTTDSFYGVPAFPLGIKLPHYTTWNVGLSFTNSPFVLDFRYYDTNLSKSDCNVITGDRTAVFGGISAATPINPSGLISNWCRAASSSV